MSLRASVRTKADEVVEVPAYEMETYELTREDHTLALEWRINARHAARRHPHHDAVRNAQRRAACLAKYVVKHEYSSPRSSSYGSHADSCGFDSHVVALGGDEAMSDHRSALESNRVGVLCEEGNARCSTKDGVAQSRDASGRRHGWNISTSFWRRSRSVGARVMPESESSVMKSYSEGSYQGQQTSRVRRMLNSVMRRTSHEKHIQHIHASGFDSLLLDASSGAADRHCDSFDNAMSEYVDGESVQHGEGETPVGRRQSSLRCFLRNGASRFKAVIENGRGAATAKE
eukprot:TRINITY_DN13225_c0_g2_i1.p1 TRINITY_DN13225_c0_g2~~TRINITY_DN13225_c0_g2_i1.p1  ORF type:complete len:288 (-),score=23.79 TRINITY_DN13225_c0_g2_i1:377-1240(-)